MKLTLGMSSHTTHSHTTHSRHKRRISVAHYPRPGARKASETKESSQSHTDRFPTPPTPPPNPLPKTPYPPPPPSPPNPPQMWHTRFFPMHQRMFASLQTCPCPSNLQSARGVAAELECVARGGGRLWGGGCERWGWKRQTTSGRGGRGRGGGGGRRGGGGGGDFT